MTPDRETSRVVLDTNVLVPASLRDTLLRAAESRLFEPLWTDHILDELRRTLVRNKMTTPEGGTRLMEALRTSFPAAVVHSHESLIDQMPNDPQDRHVLAAAVSSRAPLIVTLNVRHFLARDLSPFSVTALAPDAYLSTLFDRFPNVLDTIVTQQTASLRNPKSLDEVLASLARYAPGFVERVDEYRRISKS